MKLLPADSAPPSDHLASAAEVARSLGIEHHVLDLHEVFSREVLDPFLCSYLAGTTPNPCALCNPRIKFGALLTHARNLGCLGLATGHYVRKLEHNGRYYLGAPVDRGKDQTYFLFLLEQTALARAYFPLEGISKTEVRALAAARNLPVAGRPESQDLCFVPKGRYPEFVEQHRAPPPPGPILDLDGTVLGHHRGLHRYTLGQRHSLGLSSPRPLYVVALDPGRNAVRVGPEAALYSDRLRCERLYPMKETDLDGRTFLVKVRSTARPVTGTVTLTNEGAEIRFEQPQRGLTPGQAAVLYDDEGGVVAGGWIREVGAFT